MWYGPTLPPGVWVPDRSVLHFAVREGLGLLSAPPGRLLELENVLEQSTN
jgi:hypothetical protein